LRRVQIWVRRNPVVAGSISATIASLVGLLFSTERSLNSERLRATSEKTSREQIAAKNVQVNFERVRSDRLRLLALSQTSISRDPGRAFDDALIGAGPAEAGSLDAEHATEARTAAGAVLSACYEEARYPIDNYATSCGASINGSLFAASDGGSEDLRFAASAKDVFDSIPLPVEGGVSAAAFVGPDAIVAAILPKFAAQAGRSVAVFDVRRRTWGESRSIEDVPRVKYVEGDPRRNRVFVSGDDGRFAFGRLDDVGEFVVAASSSRGTFRTGLLSARSRRRRVDSSSRRRRRRFL
jgi:hypothetical protein